MKNIAWALATTAAVMALGTAPAYAGATCKIVPSWCPPPDPGDPHKRPVPEPATLAVLAVGAVAAGIAARRRRK